MHHHKHFKDKEIEAKIQKAIDSSMSLRNNKELLLKCIASMTPSSNVDEDWLKFVDVKKIEDLNAIISDESLKCEETYKFIINSFNNGFIQETGTTFAKILPKVSRFTTNGSEIQKGLAF